MSEIRKTKINKGGKPYLGLLPGASGPASWPAQPAGGPARLPPLSSSSSTEGGECARRARAPPRHATSSPACLPLPSSSGCPGTTPRLPPYSLTLPRFFLSSPSLSLSRVRTHPSPPFAIAAATGLPSPPRHAPQLRRDPLYLLVEPRKTEHPVEPSPSPSSPPAAVGTRRRFGSYRASPTSPSRSLVSL